jgi:hypothetical protein
MCAADAGLRKTFATKEIAETADRYRNRGRWGEDDVLGTLNIVDDAMRAHASTLARRGRTFSLSIEFSIDGPQRAVMGRVNQIHTRRETGDDAVADRQGFPHGIGGAADPVLSSIEDEQFRSTLVAHDAEGALRFDIHLQGENQTAFFEI